MNVESSPPSAGQVGPPGGNTTRPSDVVLTWDRWSGLAHLADHHRGDREQQPTFTGFAYLPAPTVAHLRTALTARGLDVASDYAVDGQLHEFRINGGVR